MDTSVPPTFSDLAEEPALEGPLDALPDRLGYTRGWRAWYLGRDDTLRSVLARLRNVRWRPGEPVSADCDEEYEHEHEYEHAAPGIDCNCGLHAGRSAEQALRFGAFDDPLERIVVGEVALWGTIVEHDRGWRAQKAYPLTLSFDTAVEPQRQRRLAESFGAALVNSTELREKLRAEQRRRHLFETALWTLFVAPAAALLLLGLGGRTLTTWLGLAYVNPLVARVMLRQTSSCVPGEWGAGTWALVIGGGLIIFCVTMLLALSTGLALLADVAGPLAPGVSR